MDLFEVDFIIGGDAATIKEIKNEVYPPAPGGAGKDFGLRGCRMSKLIPRPKALVERYLDQELNSYASILGQAFHIITPKQWEDSVMLAVGKDSGENNGLPKNRKDTLEEVLYEQFCAADGEIYDRESDLYLPLCRAAYERLWNDHAHEWYDAVKDAVKPLDEVIKQLETMPQEKMKEYHLDVPRGRMREQCYKEFGCSALATWNLVNWGCLAEPLNVVVREDRPRHPMADGYDYIMGRYTTTDGDHIPFLVALAENYPDINFVYSITVEFESYVESSTYLKTKGSEVNPIDLSNLPSFFNVCFQTPEWLSATNAVFSKL